jgi:MFS family permease
MKQITKKEREERKLRDSRRKSIKEGIYASASFALGNSYISPFAIALNASNSLVALLGSISGFLGPISQIFGAHLIGKYSRKKIVLKAVLTEALLWIPFAIIAILFQLNVMTSLLPIFVLLSFSFHTIAGNAGGPSWFSWMGDIIKDNQRGRYFSRRNLLTGFISMTLAIISSFFLDYFKNSGRIMIGFLILFALAFFFRINSWRIFRKQYEPEVKIRKKDKSNLLDFILEAPKTNFGKFTIYRFFLALAIAISGPLLAVYLLRNLNFSYTTYMLITFAGTLFSLTTITLWGKFADKYGNYKTIKITSFAIPLIPLLWIISPNPIYLVFVPSLIGGMVWAGFNLASSNFIYDNIPPGKRGSIVSYYHLIWGIGHAIGAGVGAILIKYLKTTIAPIIIIFIIGAIIRLIVVLFNIYRIKEVRKTSEFRGNVSLKNLVFKRIKPTLVEEVHQIMHIPDYLKR